MRVFATLAAAVLLGVSARGEAVAPAGPVETELRQMASAAGVIFAGQVLAVRPHQVAGTASGWVEVEFRVDAALRGCAGPTYVLREWAGLWTGGRQRYVVGQQALVMLHTPSAAGFSSPVGGQDGVIPLVGGASAPGPLDRFGESVAEPVVDLRWVEARVERPAVPGVPAASATITRAQAVVPRAVRRGMAEAQRVRRPVTGLLQAPAEAPLPRSLFTDGISLRSVMSWLGAWEAERGDGHP